MLCCAALVMQLREINSVVYFEHCPSKEMFTTEVNEVFDLGGIQSHNPRISSFTDALTTELQGQTGEDSALFSW